MKELYIEPIFDVISLVSCDPLTTSGNGTSGAGVSSSTGGSDDPGFYGGDWND